MSESYETNYKKYRGKCREFSEQAVKDDPSLRLVRGYYWCPIWNKEEQHWWCETPDGTIVDPTVLQFPSAGAGMYREYDGTVECAECGKTLNEEDATFYSNYAFCKNTPCLCKFVGVYY